jgi:invasion protein IalB
MAKLKSGKTLVFIIYRTQEVGVGIPISLAGFDQAIAGLR